MTYLYYFLILRKAYRNFENNVEIPISMDELAGLFFCTHRNAKIILTKLSEEELIIFHSGRGRGIKSTIIFKESFEQMLFKKTGQLLNNLKIDDALNLVKEFGTGTQVEEYVVTWLSHYFGYNHRKNHKEDLEVLRFPIYRQITTIDPTKVFFDLDAHLMMQVFNTLVSYDYTTRQFNPSLAHSWEVNEEKTKWLFYLRKGIKFHNRRQLTGEDVKKSILRLNNSPHQWIVEDILEIELIEKYAILFKLKKPNELFLHYVSYTPMSIVDTSQKEEGFAPFPIGTGPFKVNNIQADYCELYSFDEYFDTRSYLDRIEIIKITDLIRETLLDSHKIFVDTGENNEILNKDWCGKETVFSGTSLLTINTRKVGPLQNNQFRNKINQLINREELAKRVDPKLKIASGFIFDSKEESLQIFLEPNDEQDCGYQGETITLYTYNRHERMASYIQKMLVEGGINIELKVVGWEVIQSEEIVSNADMILFEGTPNEGIISILDLFLYERGFIHSFLSNDLKSEAKRIIDQIKQAKDSSSRHYSYLEMEQFFKEKSVLLFLFHKQVAAIYDEKLEGVKFNSRMWIDFKTLWYKHSRL